MKKAEELCEALIFYSYKVHFEDNIFKISYFFDAIEEEDSVTFTLANAKIYLNEYVVFELDHKNVLIYHEGNWEKLFLKKYHLDKKIYNVNKKKNEFLGRESNINYTFCEEIKRSK